MTASNKFPSFTKSLIDDVQQWKDFVTNYVKETIIEAGEFHAMAFWYNAETKANHFAMVNAFMESSNLKDAMVSFLKVMMAKSDPHAFILASEIWFKLAKHHKGGKLPTSIAGDPDAIDALMISFETKTAIKMDSFEVVKPSQRDKVMGCKLKLIPLDIPKGAALQGRMTEFLHQTPHIDVN